MVLMITLYAVISKPILLVGVLVLAGAWAYSHMYAQPKNLAGFTVGLRERSVVLGIVTAAFLIFAANLVTLLLILVGVSVVLVLAHAAAKTPLHDSAASPLASLFGNAAV
jgi:hypothetical protein